MNADKPTGAPRLISATTQGMPAGDKFSYWNEVICRTVVDLDCRPLEQPSFEASIGGFEVPGLGVYDIHTQPHLVYREATEIARLDNDALVVNYVTSGTLYSQQDGRSVFLKPGDAAISDAARPYFLRFDQPLGCVSVKIYKSDLGLRPDTLAQATATSLLAGSSLQPLVYGYMSQLLQRMGGLEPAAALRASGVFKELLTASLQQVMAPHGVLSESRSVSLLRVKQFVERQLCDPSLDAHTVSKGVNLSARYINKLFEAEQTSLGRFVWRRRLERCAEKLADARFAHQSISTIALEHGFNDLSHFSRAFRARWGESPRQYRDSRLLQRRPSVTAGLLAARA
jgi:AraC family transcriptional regulator, positive regulator of tynA and feaB